MKRPIIAISADQLPKASDVLNQNHADFGSNDLKEAIFAAGGLPIIVPLPENTALADATAAEILSFVDGVIIPGGADIDPQFFGESPIPGLGRTNYKRDTFEIALVAAAVTAGKPVLGICRGLQVINVALGGTLYQDLAAQFPGNSIKHAQAAYGSHPTHRVAIAADSLLTPIYGEEAAVNSRHHQAIKEIPSALTEIASAPDGVVEAIVSADSRILGVQWHPENMWRDFPAHFQLFKDFVNRSVATENDKA
ncbi:MAG: gamma-glutamyl-gamma-aminobutyrate hydrolase family protein [Streptococcaceae bacterium]|jgi:putative glutamine amidotransferase|nr:gamma-glutamyl-gamma-aminobutyrate hydrolase family protein [Streptococcaceae bacterium]